MFLCDCCLSHSPNTLSCVSAVYLNDGMSVECVSVFKNFIWPGEVCLELTGYSISAWLQVIPTLPDPPFPQRFPTPASLSLTKTCCSSRGPTPSGACLPPSSPGQVTAVTLHVCTIKFILIGHQVAATTTDLKYGSCCKEASTS